MANLTSCGRRAETTRTSHGTPGRTCSSAVGGTGTDSSGEGARASGAPIEA